MLEGNIAEEEDVEQRSKRPHRRRFGFVLAGLENFGREEFGRPARLGIRLVRIEFGRAAKVDEFDFERLGVDQNVLVLNVAMEDALLVQTFAALDNLAEDDATRRLRNCTT